MGTIEKNKTDQILARVKSFPGLPGAAVKLLALLRDPHTNVAQVEAILRNDPSLTANVLKLTNSAYFGLPSKIASVRQAVLLLGSKKLIQLVLASCVQTVMNRAVEGYDLPAGELWRHSIAVSVTAEALAGELKIPMTDVVFTTALLHDVGKLALGAFVRDDLEKIEDSASGSIPFEAAEQSVLGTNHAEIGALILKNWSFPPDVVSAVQWHHDPEAGGATDNLTDIVHVADVLSLMIGIGVGREGLQYQASAAATKRLGIKPFHLEKVSCQTLQWVNGLADVLEAN